MQNLGVADAFNVTLLDRLPDSPTGGMCDTTPQILSARVFAADGVTPIAGKGPLVQGTDYTLAYNGAACELTLTTLTARFGDRRRRPTSDRHLSHAARLRPFQYGGALTNVAGATQWYNDASTNPTRLGYTRTLTNGTVGTVDHEDAHTVTVVPRLYAEKAAALQVDAMSPGIVDPGDVLRYTITIYNNGSVPVTQAVLRDLVPANTTYVADSMTLNALPVGRPDGGVSPLVAGVDVSSSNLTPPLPGAGAGTLSAGQNAVVHIRSARERRRAARHGDHEPGRRRHGRAAGSLDRRRRQPRDRARADRRRRRQPAGSQNHEGRFRRRRRARARGRDARVRRASDERRHPAGHRRRDPRRHRGADAGVSVVRGSCRGR